MSSVVEGRVLVGGAAEGELVHAAEALSFWGGVDPASGVVVDRHHPLAGTSLAGRVLAVPSGRGSCSGSGVLLELILNGHAPAAVVVCEPEEIITLGSIVGAEAFGRSVPVLQIDRDAFRAIAGFSRVCLEGGRLWPVTTSTDGPRPPPEPVSARTSPADRLRLDPTDQAFLDGRHGRAGQMAMRLLVRMAALQGADRLIDIAQVHVDGCIYTGPASLRFARLLVEWGAWVRVPTTLNAISVDRRRWREQGVEAGFGEAAAALADAYVAMGARPTFTCAPYLLADAPRFGEQIGWAESNAVVYANSVIGARTMKYPDFLDICIALTGRAPEAGCHTDAGRQATLALALTRPAGADDSFWPLAGHCCGSLAGSAIPLILGLEESAAGPTELKAFGAAFATTAAAPMFHMAGVTPEAGLQNPERRLTIDRAALRRAWDELNTASDATIGLVSLGNPHFSLEDCARLAALVEGRRRSPGVTLTVTCGRDIHGQAREAGFVAAVEAFGGTFVTDTCWCMLGEPVVPPEVRTLMTNSAKYAHYAPGLVGRDVRFGSLASCVEAACRGTADPGPPAWLA